MRHWVAILVLGVAAAMPAQKQRITDTVKPVNPTDYALTVHVTHAQLSGWPAGGLLLDAVIDGKKVELETNAGELLHVGDYKARLVQDDESKSGLFSKTYELLFVDGTHLNFIVVAESE